MGRARPGERGPPSPGPGRPVVPAAPPRRRARALALLGALLAAAVAAVAARVYTHLAEAQAAARQVGDAGMGRGERGAPGRTVPGEGKGLRLEEPQRGGRWTVTPDKGTE